MEEEVKTALALSTGEIADAIYKLLADRIALELDHYLMTGRYLEGSEKEKVDTQFKTLADKILEVIEIPTIRLIRED